MEGGRERGEREGEGEREILIWQVSSAATYLEL
jgi:hypothetical protein